MEKAIDIVSSISYSDGSVVSRTLKKNDAGTVTLFSFDAGQGLSEHSAPFDAIVQILDGEAELTIGGKTITVGGKWSSCLQISHIRLRLKPGSR